MQLCCIPSHPLLLDSHDLEMRAQPCALSSKQCLSQQLTIPVIGIGAGEDCDGQVRVTADLLGLTPSQPPFSPPLIQGRQLCVEALQGWEKQLHQQAETATTTTSPPEPDC